MPDRPHTIAVDFDGVIHAYTRGWHDGTIYDQPVPGAIDALRELTADHAVFVFTSREPEQVMPWLERYGFDVALDGDPDVQFWNHKGQILVTNRKLPATVYLDDRAVRFRDWDQALTDVRAVTAPPPTAAERNAQHALTDCERLEQQLAEARAGLEAAQTVITEMWQIAENGDQLTDTAESEAARYRAAWRSARQRAAGLAEKYRYERKLCHQADVRATAAIRAQAAAEAERDCLAMAVQYALAWEGDGTRWELKEGIRGILAKMPWPPNKESNDEAPPRPVEAVSGPPHQPTRP